MNPAQRRLLLFAAQFVPLFVLFLWLYLQVVSAYQPLVVGTANVVTQRLYPPTHIEMTDDGTWHAYVFTDETGTIWLRGWKSYVPHLILLSLPLLPALLLATPAPWGNRLRLIGVALPLIFLIHVLSVVGLTRGVQCLAEAPGTFHCLWLLRVVYTSGQVFAAVLWALMTWKYWFPAVGAKRPGHAPKRGTVQGPPM